MESSPPRRVHLDNGGRAPWHPLAREAFLQALDDGWADPRRLHAEGRRAARLVDGAREAVAAVLGARTEEVRFTHSHTAALHRAVLAGAAGRRRAGDRVVVGATERAAVLHAADAAGRRETIPVDRLGRGDAGAFAAAVAGPGVALAALQHANGEVGTLQPVEQVHDAARAAGVPLLVDAGASLGHARVPETWDLLAADPADWGGPSGVGVLAARGRVRLPDVGPEDAEPWAPGGVSVPLAFASAVALESVQADLDAAGARRRELVDRIRAVVAGVPDVEVVGDPENRLPHVVTFSFLYVDGEALVTELDRQGFAVGSGSACTASTLEPSHVLAAMGVLTHGNVRIALDRTTSAEDVERFLAVLPPAVERVRDALGVRGL
ncbi:cysteine desulfurase family protein [Myceligenerans pegani]|uniref:Aminotransferase class V-fold PLP-dependent enzyme n=1 Tax=Myceligenerans pegani TaxID=2776917 RepID=A0ABR9N127_9MICO|nr:aminotransferase class V-fold PLP-dependent enzyme [Myceligenerans sp. TRM 65318]MBE1876986.1 aminotransferase class V-fold PLP-dependent enzyme [Myceligenerans sp. TRM 65318]MBE3019257.1 aminotransferase class V-fold PLP-dependent enzyme [Myceligenerans sp. TRM 65318]